MSTPNAWQHGAFQTDAFQIDAGGDGGITVALTGQEAASASGRLEPGIRTAAPAQPQGAGSGKRRRKPWIVTVDGKDWVVDTLAEAHALYEQLKPAQAPVEAKKKPAPRVSVEIRLEDSPPIALRWDGKPLAQVIVERAPDEGAIRAAAEAWVRALEEDDEEVLLLL